MAQILVGAAVAFVGVFFGYAMATSSMKEKQQPYLDRTEMTINDVLVKLRVKPPRAISPSCIDYDRCLICDETDHTAEECAYFKALSA